ncbi:MAG: TonB-dependent receptor [Candidatus Marinimicrobia bacterium]|nr:TonB-dependent receptor [Candidatus Neomarinimicrobiota bacterium]
MLYIILFIIFFSNVIFASTISGFIEDKADSEPISYANVYLKNTSVGAVTNKDGYFYFKTNSTGKQTLFVTMMGYEKLEKELIIKKSSSIKVKLQMKKVPIELGEVTVTAEMEKFKKDVRISTISLSNNDLRSAPVILEADVFRTIQMLPSATAGNDFSSALYVRGGSPDQNLILLDGITIYNPYHLGGVFSTFNNDAIKEVEFMAGGFPAKYGGRMSSVLSITNREGNAKHFKGQGNISLISSKILLEGPVPRGSFMIAGRRTYFDGLWELIRKPLNKKREADNKLPAFPYYFYDFQAKLNIDINQKHRTTFSGFFGDDVLKINQETTFGNKEDYDYYRSKFAIDWIWGNRTISVQHRWIISPSLISKFSLAQSKFHFDVDFDVEDTFFNEDSVLVNEQMKLKVYDYITDVSPFIDFVWFANSKNTVEFGAFYKKIDFDLGLEYESRTIIDIGSKPSEYGIYFQDKFQPSPLFMIQPGIRLTHYEFKHKIYPDFRLNAKYFLSDKFAINGAVGNVYQFLQTANPESQEFRIIDFWYPTSKEQEPSIVKSGIVGAEYWYEEKVQFKLEGYYKDYQHLITLDDGLMGAFDSTNNFTEAKGYAYGAEFLIKKQIGNLTGWVGYTYSITRKKDGNIWYSPKYDKTHNLNIVAKYDIGNKWYFSSALVYNTGNPYTQILGKIHLIDDYSLDSENNRFRFDSYGTEFYGEKNSERYPNYFRLDVGFNRRGKLFKIDTEFYLHIINVTNHMNVFMYWWMEDYNKIYRQPVPMFPFFPSLGIKFNF